MHFSYLIAAVGLLAGSVMGNANFTVGTNFTASQLVDFSANPGFVEGLNACGPNDLCICTNETGKALFDCEQCLFTAVIEQNLKVPSPLIGSQPALGAFTLGCASVNITVEPHKLVIPPSWDGPESNQLGLGATVVAVAAGAILGAGSLYVLASIE
ncbi:hypothetical protein BU17DRAFT_63352 [Hysterangium stoloniferum]|nr:hypothetical protein BU17DRAFT_63352 [Hysterangium stoloniferum]